MYRYFVKMKNGGEMMSQLFDSYEKAYQRMESTLDLDHGVKLVYGRVAYIKPSDQCIINGSTTHTIKG